MSVKWKDIQIPSDLDKCKLDEEKRHIRELEEEFPEDKRCPCLKKVGSFSYYCGATRGSDGVVEAISPEDYKQLLGEKMCPTNPIYASLLDLGEMSLYCFGRYESCCYKNGSLEPIIHILMKA